MTRLDAEWQRLFVPPVPLATDAAAGTGPASPPPVRALVLALGRPADWQALGVVWRAVQSELGLPAPAIAVSGSDSLQLWFALADPVPRARGEAFLQALVARWMPAVAPARLSLWPSGAQWVGAVGPAAPHPPRVPGPVAATGGWSAFVAPDLVALFEDSPALDLPPGDEAQADMLSRCRPARADEWAGALAALGLDPKTASAVASATADASEAGLVSPRPESTAHAGGPTARGAPVPLAEGLDEAEEARAARQQARAFLLAVMQDASLPWTTRVDAARGLLS